MSNFSRGAFIVRSKLPRPGASCVISSSRSGAAPSAVASFSSEVVSSSEPEARANRRRARDRPATARRSGRPSTRHLLADRALAHRLRARDRSAATRWSASPACATAGSHVARAVSSSEPRFGSSSRKSRSDAGAGACTGALRSPLVNSRSRPAGFSSGSANRSTSTRFSPPSRLTSTRSTCAAPASPLNIASSGAICLPMMRTLSHSPGAACARGAVQLARGVEEQVLVAPHEVDFQELELQVAAAGLAADRDLHQVGGLVVQAVSHVEVGFGQRVLLIETHLRFAAHRLVDARADAAGAAAAAGSTRDFVGSARRAVGAGVGSSDRIDRSSSESSTTNESRSRAFVTGDIAGAARVERGSKSRPAIASTGDRGFLAAAADEGEQQSDDDQAARKDEQAHQYSPMRSNSDGVGSAGVWRPDAGRAAGGGGLLSRGRRLGRRFGLRRRLLRSRLGLRCRLDRRFGRALLRLGQARARQCYALVFGCRAGRRRSARRLRHLLRRRSRRRRRGGRFARRDQPQPVRFFLCDLRRGLRTTPLGGLPRDFGSRVRRSRSFRCPSAPECAERCRSADD